MKNFLLVFLFTSSCYVAAFAQWTEYASGFITPNLGINQIVATSSTNAWATAFDATALTTQIRDYTRTTDGGLTWTASTVSAAPNTYNWSCFTAIDENTAWGLFYKSSTGTTGGIFKTTDGGNTWSQQGTGSVFSTSGASFPDVIYFWDANRGVAVGDPVNNEFEIYNTDNGGTTWTAVAGANIPDPANSSKYGLTRSFAARGNTLWFGTNAGRVFKTTDYGASWTVYNTGSTNAIGSMEFSNDNDGWIELDDPSSFAFLSLYRTTDGGANWSDITPAGTFFSSYNSVGISYVPTTDNVLVACGLDNVSGSFGSSYSLDGGDSWITIDSAVTHLAVDFFNNVTGYNGSVNLDQSNFGVFKYDGGFVATDVQDVKKDNHFKLYPNPSDGLFYISFDGENNLPISLEVTDAMGKVVFQKTYKDKSQLWLRSIDLRNFKNGVYFMRVENNGTFTNQKLVIQ